VMPAVMRWRLGYHRVFSLLHDTTTAFGHMGYNGSMAWCDPNRDLAVAFVHNYDVTMLGDIRQFILNETILNFFDSN
jgi:CubicO group peptidase (beta-lactamase class C family)